MNEYQYGAAGAPAPALALAIDPQPVTVGRYLLHRQIARGGMATIHIARLIGDKGFSRIVAAKRLLPEFAEDAEFVAMFLDEARVASRVHHRNVVPVLDVVATGDEVMLVQEYVHGAPLHWLLRTARRNRSLVPLEIAVSIACQVLSGLDAAHHTLDELGLPLHIVHRDVSPQNVMVAVDGTARLLDFGVAKATMAAHVTREGQFKGKLAYSAPEQLCGQATQQSDLYSLAVVLWELVVGHRMHQGAKAELELVTTIMNGRLPTITEALAGERDAMSPERWRQLEAIEPIIQTGLAVELSGRWATAADMEHALMGVQRPASSGEVTAWVRSLGRELIDKNNRVLADEEASWRRVVTVRQGRLTPVPGEVPQVTQASMIAEPSAVPPPQRPVAPGSRSGVIAWIALLGGPVAALAICIVFAARGSAAEPAPDGALPSAARLPGARPAPDPAPPPAVVGPTAPAPRPAAAPPVEPAGVVAPEPAPTVIELPITRKPGPPVRAVRPAPSSHTLAVVKKPAIPPSAAAPAPAAEPAIDCNPPYYYEGPKKFFKPSCLDPKE